MEIVRPEQVWSTDITYVPMPRGFMYLTAVIDWYSRYVLAWRLSNSLEGSFCLEVLEEALQRGQPEIFNTDQGVQYTAAAFTGRLQRAGALVSMTRKRVPTRQSTNSGLKACAWRFSPIRKHSPQCGKLEPMRTRCQTHGGR